MISAAQDTAPQAPAPVVRVRPHPQTAVPTTAPPDAAPLVTHPARPRVVNPQALDPATGAPLPTPRTTAPRPPATTTIITPKPSGSPSQTAAASTAPARPALSATSLNRTVVVLDPAHGGADVGARIGPNLLEKDVTLALGFRLRSLLLARGFLVDLTRDNDSALAPPASVNATPAALTLDDRAGIANHAHAAACLLLHATGRGNGVHLYTPDLAPAPGEVFPAPWLTAQAPWVPASQQLARSLGSALGRSQLNLLTSTASIRPMDSLTCPALVLELAPERSGEPASILDSAYLDRVANALAGALIFWQTEVQPPPRLTGAIPTAHAVHRRATPLEPQP